MASFLDRDPPIDFSDPVVRDLWALLAANYWNKAAARDMLAQVHVDAGEIDWDRAVRWVWRDILALTFRRGKLRPLLTQLMDGDDEAVAERIRELMATSPVSQVPDAAAAQWKGGDTRLEALMQAESTLLDIAFLRRGVELGPAVCRLTVTHSGRQYWGTGFRIADDLLLTNHHVLFNPADGQTPAAAVEAWFGYERTFSGLDQKYTVVTADPATIKGGRGHDWATVRARDAMPGEAPVIALRGAQPVRVDDRVYIIQHPAGGAKKIGMIHNVVRYVSNDVLQYLTDTEGARPVRPSSMSSGSSSPCTTGRLSTPGPAATGRSAIRASGSSGSSKTCRPQG